MDKLFEIVFLDEAFEFLQGLDRYIREFNTGYLHFGTKQLQQKPWLFQPTDL
jgi:hypothetical protein